MILVSEVERKFCNFLKHWNTFLFLRMTHNNNIHLTLCRWRSTTRAGGGGSSTDSSGPTANSSDFFFPFDEPIKMKQSHTMEQTNKPKHTSHQKRTTPGEGQARLQTYMKRRVRRVFLLVYLTLGRRNALKQMVFWSPKTEHFSPNCD